MFISSTTIEGSAPAPQKASRPSALLLLEDDTIFRPHYGLFGDLPLEEQTRILSLGARKRYARGEQVFRQGDTHAGVFIIQSGRVRVYYEAPSGREITLAYWGPGHFVGGPNVVSCSTHQWSGVVEASGSIVFLEAKILRKLASEMPQLALAIIEGLSFKGRCYSTLAQMLGTRSVTERLAHLLQYLCEAFGVEVENGTLIGNSFTHAELANMVGATRQWVTISLKKMERRGVIACHNTTITICRPDLLAEVLEQKE
jgi:CRP/FNR family transcriptional regulator, cyclic AMP receptor protein